MAARLPPDERERRKRARAQQRWADINSGAAYKKYNPNDGLGRGSDRQWSDTAERVRGGVIQILKTDADLELLDLTDMPKDQQGLTRAYRKASLRAHPDTPGGSHEKFLALTEAYDRLSAKLASA